MPTPDLACHRVAFLVSDGFERSELHRPLQAIREAGAHAVVITPDGEAARAWADGDWADTVEADADLDAALAADFDALVLPGGVMNPDHLRTDPRAISLVKGFVAQGKPIAAICHGPWTLIDANAVHGKTLTSWPSLQRDLRNAGAEWVDREVVVDGELITSRHPGDLDAFCAAITDRVAGRPVAVA